MAREKQFESAAEKQAAYRERQRLAAVQAEAEPEAPVLPVIEVDRPAPPLEEYVAAQLALTRRDIEVRSRNRDTGEGGFTVDSQDRLKRSEDYARWRYAGYKAGEVMAL